MHRATIHRLLLLLASWLAPSLASAGALDAVPALTWYPMPGTAIRSVLYAWPAGVTTGASMHLRSFDESGATYDTLRHRLLIWGGGHGDYAGNEIYAFDLATLAWSRLRDPSLNTDPAGVTELSGYYPDAAGVPDPQQPRSRHGYWYQAYIPTIDRYCSFGVSYTYPNARSLPNVDCYDFTAQRWERKADALTYDGLAWALYDPQTQHVFVHGLQWDNTRGFWAEYDPIADTWTRRSDAPSGAMMRAAPLLDTTRHQIVLLGAGEVRVVSLTATGTLPSRVVTPTGAVEILAMQRGGFAYDQAQDLYVAWSGDASVNLSPGDLWTIDPETWVITKITPAAPQGAPAMPTTFGGQTYTNGVYGRWFYSPELSGMVLINNHHDEPVWFVRVAPRLPPAQPAMPTGLRVRAAPLPPPPMSGMPSLADEQATYRRWGWTWQASQEPHLATPYADQPTRAYTVSDPDIHGDTEGDDLWSYLVAYQRTGQPGYLARAQAWARYFLEDYRQCMGDGYHSYCYDATLWEPDGSGSGGYGYDHMYGWGLLAWYQYTQDVRYLDAARALAGDVETYYSHAKFVPGIALSGGGNRGIGRHLLLVTRLATITQESRWMALRDKLVTLLLAASDWDGQYGIYWLGQYVTDAYLSAGAYASGVRIISPWMSGILAEGMAEGYAATGNAGLRERLIAMARFAQRYALDPTSHYAGYVLGVNIVTGARVQYNTWPGIAANPPTWNPAFTLALTNLFVLGYQYSGDASLLDAAKLAFDCGTHGQYGTAAPCAAPSTTVHHFIDTQFETSTGGFYLDDNKGELFYTHRIFERGGAP